MGLFFNNCSDSSIKPGFLYPPTTTSAAIVFIHLLSPSKLTAHPGQGFGMIGMSGYRAEAAAAAHHVAQQSRRNKMRVVQTGGEQMMQVRDVYDPAMFSSSGVMGFGNPGGDQFQYQEAMDGGLIGGQYQDGGQGMQFAAGYCQNGLQEVVSSSSAGGNQGMGMAGWDGGNELLLLPSYANQGGNPNPRIGGTGAGAASVWMGRDGEFSVTQGLSLSLASNPATEMQGGSEVGVLGSYSKMVASNRGFSHCEGMHGGVGSSVDVRRAVGPLGPFTGYATILKSSKFLKPAQQLLVEFCNAVTGPNAGRDGAVAEKEGGGSLSSFYGSVEAGGGGGNGNGTGSTVLRPEFQQKKAKLLVMQEEVCRRYKQYHQQMQMVVSSFESVSGLSTATPYTSLALKSVSKHFRCIKNAISDQIRHMSKMLGEELMSSPSSSRGDNNIATPRSKFIDQSLRKSGETLSGFTDHNPPVWRPQRGLPERSVAVLRAWLFEHFLHPYPTDTDKHMLATQTGLSRNQVSNWFINARVRLWKPMVEEIHMLETKGMAEMNLNSGNKNDGKMAVNNQQGSGAQSNKHSSDCSSMVSPANDESYRSLEQWHREKRSRMENCIVPGNIDGGLMSFYHGGMEMAGLGAVSLTLGLRHSDGAVGAAHQPPPQQQQMTRHFGNQLVHDFVA